MTSLTDAFIRAHRQLRPGAPVPEIRAEFFPYAGLTHTIRRRSGQLSARVSDVLSSAPPEIFSAVASILLARLYRRRVDASLHERYRRYILSDAVQQRAHAARRTRGRRSLRSASAAGNHVDLERTFDRLNARFFESRLSRPALSWTQLPSRRRLGHYDAARHVIFISRLFDSPDVPAYVVEYILFHEMLHIKYPSRSNQGRMITHSTEFRTAERAFPLYNAAHNWLDKTLGGDGTNTSLDKLA
jgi:predicted metal-dependent hydrolase